MRQIQNHNIAELLMQLRFTPEEKRRKQLAAAEKLLGLIDSEKEYPFEFICYQITEFRPKGLEGQLLIKGSDLAEDLRIFISKLSGQIAESVEIQDQKVYSTQELAEKFGVSTKTIYRWRKRGLIALKFIFDDGVKRFGFLQSSVDKFVDENPQLVGKAKIFRQLSAKDKELIVKRAVWFVDKSSLSRYQIIDKIALEIGRVHETVRYTLLNYEKLNPLKPIFRKPSGVISSSQASELYRLYGQGAAIKELMHRFGRSRSSVYRIINRRRTRSLLSRKIEFIASDEFLETNVKDRILGSEIADLNSASEEDQSQLSELKAVPLLSRDREVELFRRYNCLKYLAFQRRIGLNPACASGGRIKEIEGYLAQAEAVKNTIIKANLGLVISIARKHTLSGAHLQDLISEGNFSLMNAVEKFDYTRGVRFGSYASWAISKDYARKIPAESSRPDKAKADSMANIQRDMRTTESVDITAIEQAHRSLVEVIRNELNEREQYIIINHFGLIGTLIRKEKKTLKQIGDDLGLSKERIRQIELIALQKLKHSLSIEEFELLRS